MLIHNADLQLILDLVGVFVFALSGGLVAVKKQLDLFGVLVLAGAAALGGGVLRDLLIGAGLAVFAVGGSLKALGAGVSPVTAVLVGVITAVGGAMLRDVLAGQVPEVLRGELYAVPALFGSLLVVVANNLGHLNSAVVGGSVAAVFGPRMLAVVLDLNAPQPLRTGESL